MRIVRVLPVALVRAGRADAAPCRCHVPAVAATDSGDRITTARKRAILYGDAARFRPAVAGR